MMALFYQRKFLLRNLKLITYLTEKIYEMERESLDTIENRGETMHSQMFCTFLRALLFPYSQKKL